MTTERILKNARIVLKDEIVEGNVLIRDGKIASIDTGCAPMQGGTWRATC